MEACDEGPTRAIFLQTLHIKSIHIVPSHCFSLLASITMRAIVMDSEMMKRTLGLRF